MVGELIELEEGWNFIQKSILAMRRMVLHEVSNPEQQMNMDPEKMILTYTTIYNMCMQRYPHNYEEQLYKRYKESFEDYINSDVIPALTERCNEFFQSEMYHASLFGELVKRWENHKIMVRKQTWFFSILDDYYAPRNRLPRLSKVGYNCFRTLVYMKIRYIIRDAIIDLIERERNGERILIDPSLLKSVVTFFVEMGFALDHDHVADPYFYYQHDLEKFLLFHTTNHYQKVAPYVEKEYSYTEYMLKVEEIWKRDNLARIIHSFFDFSRRQFLEIVEHELITRYHTELLEKIQSECLPLIRDNKVNDLSMIYKLVCRILGALRPFAVLFEQNLSFEGAALVQKIIKNFINKNKNTREVQLEQVVVEQVVELYDKHYSKYITVCFQNHPMFHKALKKGFANLCNISIGGRKSAEVLASLCDNLMKKGGSGELSDEEIEDLLNKVMKVLAYINDKDLFFKYSKTKLVRRLLVGEGGNGYYLERNMLSKFKQELAGHLTSNMEQMVVDVTLAQENQKLFEEYSNADENGAKHLDIDLAVIVLRTGIWPSFNSPDLILPKEMVKSIQMFEEFYQTREQKRKLTWIFSEGTCNILSTFHHKVIDLVMNPCQAAVLLLFNAVDRLSYCDIKTQVNLGDEDLVVVLHSLSCYKYKVIKKKPDTTKVEKKDVFEWNGEFTFNARRITIPLHPNGEKVEKKAVARDVDRDRQCSIDACIIRIMKSRKELTREILMLKCVEQLSSMFKPDIKIIKKRIEALILREYLEPVGDKAAMSYRYLA